MKQKQIVDIWRGVTEKNWGTRRLKAEIKSGIHIRSVGLYITHKCNLRCKHCFWATSNTVEEELSITEWHSIIKQFINHGTRHFHICGREPLVSEKLFDILSYLNELKNNYKIEYGIITNGTLVKKKSEKIANYNLDYLDFSIDGTKEGNDILRGKGSFERVMGGIKCAIEKRLATSISSSTVIYNKNLDELMDMTYQLYAIGIKHLFFQPVRNYGKLHNNWVVFPQDLSYAILQLKEIIKDFSNITIEFEIPPTYLPFLYENNKLVTDSFNLFINNERPIIKISDSNMIFRYHIFCQAYWRRARITADGFFIGCDVHLTDENYEKYSIGNLRYKNLDSLMQSIITSPTFNNIMNTYKNTSCRNCPNFKLCVGGCRSMPFIEYNDWNEKDPMCVHTLEKTPHGC